MYRQLLWNKELPSGGRFKLTFGPGSSLVFRSALGAFHLASEIITSGLLERGPAVVREIPHNELSEHSGYNDIPCRGRG